MEIKMSKTESGDPVLVFLSDSKEDKAGFLMEMEEFAGTFTDMEFLAVTSILEQRLIPNSKKDGRYIGVLSKKESEIMLSGLIDAMITANTNYHALKEITKGSEIMKRKLCSIFDKMREAEECKA